MPRVKSKAKKKAKSKDKPRKGERPCSQCGGRNRSQSKYSTCKSCREKNARRAKKRYAELKQLGRCVRCGKSSPEGSYCDPCLDYMSQYW